MINIKGLDEKTKMKAHLLLTHGAGASCQSQFMQQLAAALRLENIKVTLFDFAYMRERLVANSKRPPPKAALLVSELAQALSDIEANLPLFVGGKSMGGRVASLFAALQDRQEARATKPDTIQSAVPDDEQNSLQSQAQSRINAKVQAIFAYGYPFHPPKKTVWRTDHFSVLKLPLFIMQGERDPFGTRFELHDMAWPNVSLNWLPAADHDFKPLKRSGLTQAILIQQAAILTSRYIDAVITKSE